MDDREYETDVYTWTDRNLEGIDALIQARQREGWSLHDRQEDPPETILTFRRLKK
jgi:hypothetical protein